MEQLTPIQNSVSFEGFFQFSQHDRLISDAERLSVLEQLISSLDFQLFGHTFLMQLAARIPVCGLTIRWPQGALQWGREATYSKRMSVGEQSGIMVGYCFAKVPSAMENRVLEELHDIAVPSLKNVIEHHNIKCLASKDSLTGLGNRAAFNDVLSRQFSHSRRTGATFGLLMIDMDRFKSINDQFGHQEGDKVLEAMATVITASLRDTDFAFRFGGDEFCCVIQDADSVALRRISQRIRRTMLEQAILARHQMRCSIGASLYQNGDEPDALFERADMQLYQDKQRSYPLCRTA